MSAAATWAAAGLAGAAVVALTSRGGRPRLARIGLVEAASGLPAREVPGRWAVALAVAGLLVALRPPWTLALGGLALAVGGGRLLARRRARQRSDATNRAVVELVVALAAELRAGKPLHLALAAAATEAGPLARRVATAAEAVRLGADPVQEIEELAGEPGAAALTAVAACLAAARRVGAPVADVLDALVTGLDMRARLVADLDAALAGSRATVQVLVALPLAGLALGASFGAPVGHVLLGTPAGRLMLLGAALLDVIGAAWMTALARRAVLR